MPPKTKTETKPEGLTPEQVLQGELSTNKEFHYNFEDEVYFKVSTGSLNMDVELDGGIGPGVTFLSGPFESGKTSFALACMKNMLETIPDSRGFLIKAEGRLGKEMMERTGIKFVFRAEEWKDGTCFVYETNIYETALSAMRNLIMNNGQHKRYFFFIDSMDGMTLKDDAPKEIGAGVRVAGMPMLSKQFLQKMAIAMTKRGHLCFIAGQISANIQLDVYAAGGHRALPGGGGNAKDHASNVIVVFKHRVQGDLLLENPGAQPDRFKNKICGHNVKCLLKKTPNEKSGITVTYPIKYGRTNGKSVWVEYEIVDMLIMFELMEKKGSWLRLVDPFYAELTAKGFKEVPQQLQGVDQWRTLLEERPDITGYLFAKFKAMIGGSR